MMTYETFLAKSGLDAHHISELDFDMLVSPIACGVSKDEEESFCENFAEELRSLELRMVDKVMAEIHVEDKISFGVGSIRAYKVIRGIMKSRMQEIKELLCHQFRCRQDLNMAMNNLDEANDRLDETFNLYRKI